MSAPHAVFDLAVNRADAALRGLRPTDRDRHLQEWHARTRFARRVRLEEVVRCLDLKPDGEWHWAGGPEGEWVAGKARFP